jgi:murein DD-endopeptidase MepM/ murein hydrolase activator NlpD
MLASVTSVAVFANAGLPIDVASAEGPNEEEAVYVVRRGDTLAAIAQGVGVSLRALMRDNGISHPREIYPGQTLRLPTARPLGWTTRAIAWNEDFLFLTRATGVTVSDAAEINRLLRFTELPVGYPVLLPPALLPVREVMPPTPSPAPRLTEAVRRNLRLWNLLRLNPTPYIEGMPLLIPELSAAAGPAGEGRAAAGSTPYPVTHLSLAPQPAIRGETTLVSLHTAEPADCVLYYLDQLERCYSAADGRLYGLVGLPTMMAPGRYTVTVEVRPDPPTSSVTIALPLLVNEGRYDYERIDLPPSRQSLLDPSLSAAERQKIAALQQTRSDTRHWTLPFSFPLRGSVTSYFGSRRSYGYGFGSFHGGTDFRAEVGAPIRAPTAGVVILAEPLVVQGKAVMIDHGWGIVSGYWHMSRIDVEVGQHVAYGETIGAVGNTGLSTGPHLHWQLWVNGVAVNALPWLDEDGPIPTLWGP